MYINGEILLFMLFLAVIFPGAETTNVYVPRAYNRQPSVSKKLSKYTEDECDKKTGMLLAYLINGTEIPEDYKDVKKFGLYSGSNINDLGDYYGCQSIKNISRYIYVSFTLTLKPLTNVSLGLCFFKECEASYYQKAEKTIFDFLRKMLNLTIADILFYDSYQETMDYRERYRIWFYVAASILGVIVLTNLISTLHKSYDNPESKFWLFVSYFNIRKNVRDIFNWKKDTELDTLFRIFDGVKVGCIGWIILGNNILLNILYYSIQNLGDLEHLIKSKRIVILFGAVYAADVFFYVSGFLFYYNLNKYLVKSNYSKVRIFFHYLLKRYFRLIPLYAFALFIVTPILPFLGEGPNYIFVEKINYYCSRDYWQNLLFINNFFCENNGFYCVSHGWFIACEMQFTILCLIIMLVLQNHKIIRNILFFLIVSSCCVIQYIQAYKAKFRSYDLIDPDISVGDYFNDFLTKPWVRIGGYIIGIWFFEMFKNSDEFIKDSNENTMEDRDRSLVSFTYKLNRGLVKSNVFCFFWALIGLIFLNTVIYINYMVNNNEMSFYVHAFFITFNKQFFALGVAMFLHVILIRKFEIGRQILSLKIFTPISKVVYGMYILHMYIMMVFFSSYGHVFYLSVREFIYFTFSFFVASWLFSIVFTVIIEIPFKSMLHKNLLGDNKDYAQDDRVITYLNSSSYVDKSLVISRF